MTITDTKKEKRELDAYIKSQNNRLENFKSYIIGCMGKLGVDKIDSALYTIGLRKPTKIVEIEDQDVLPVSIKTVVQSIKVDKIELKRLLKLGEIKGAKLVDGKQNLTIKVRK